MEESDLLAINKGYKAELRIKKQVEKACLKFEYPPREDLKVELATSTAISFVWMARTRTPSNLKYQVESLYKDHYFLLHLKDESIRLTSRTYDYQGLWQRLKSLILKINPEWNPDEADDTVGDALNVLVTKVKSKNDFSLYSSLPSYLGAICMNLCFAHYREEKKKTNPLKTLPKESAPAAVTEQQLMMLAEVNQVVATDFLGLDEGCKKLLLSHYGWDEEKVTTLKDASNDELKTNAQALIEVLSDDEKPKTLVQLTNEKEKEVTVRQRKNRCLTALSLKSIPTVVEILNNYDEGIEIKKMLEQRLRDKIAK